MTDSEADPPLSEDDRRSLKNLLARGAPDRFRAAVVVVSNPAQWERIVCWLEAQAGDLERSSRRVDLASLPGENLWAELHEALPQPRPQLLLLFGLEGRLEHGADRLDLIRQLNVQRDLFVRDIGAMWVLFVHPDTAMHLSMDAPDFVDYVTSWVVEKVNQNESFPIDLKEAIEASFGDTPAPAQNEWLRSATQALKNGEISRSLDIIDAAKARDATLESSPQWQLMQRVARRAQLDEAIRIHRRDVLPE